MSYMHKYSHEGGAPGHTHTPSGQPYDPGKDTMRAAKGEMSEAFYIDNIQKTLTIQFPWELLDMPKPSVVRDGKMNPSTQQALQKVKQVATDLNNRTALDALVKIDAGDYHKGASELWDSALEIMRDVKTDETYFQQRGEQHDWNYQTKTQYLQSGVFPSYFPKPWQAKNMCAPVSGGKDRQWKVPQTDEDFRVCQTPIFNHFLMWGPSCPNCGTTISDPRYLKLKSKYPEAFTPEKNKHRRVNHIWSPTVPSPGIRPYVAPPPAGSPYYSNPRDPKPETEGVRFFDSEDEALYYEYLEKYNQFKEQFGAEAEAYNKKFFEMRPHKQTVSRGKPPNEWSVAQYGRTEPLWPDGTRRPDADVLKQRIQEKGVSLASTAEISLKFAKDFSNFIKNL